MNAAVLFKILTSKWPAKHCRQNTLLLVSWRYIRYVEKTTFWIAIGSRFRA
jgi:hypothetical protein